MTSEGVSDWVTDVSVSVGSTMDYASSSPVPSPATSHDTTESSEGGGGEVGDALASVSLMLHLSMLVIAMLCGYAVKRNKIHCLPEAGASMLLGIGLSAIVMIVKPGENFSKWIDFQEGFFFLFLLPPIIFESGYSMQPKPFFMNFGAICSFAFYGTFVSSVGVGLIVWGVGAIGITYPIPFLEAMLFGSLISATDPVSVLAIFNELGADIDLYAFVFGESGLNDAVAIVLFRTFAMFLDTPVTGAAVGKAIGTAILIFVGSFVIGTVVALASALLTKYVEFAQNEAEKLEAAIVVVLPYIAYMAAEALHLSGIVAILFCGIVMAHYATPNMSEGARESVGSFYKLITTLCENFVFVYMGSATFMSEQSWAHFGFTAVAILACLIGRALNVYPSCWAMNLIRPVERRISNAHMHMTWLSGLRGAMAFALALLASRDPRITSGNIIKTTTFFIIVVGVLAIGGSTATLLDKFNLRGTGGDYYDDLEKVTAKDIRDEEEDAALTAEADGKGAGKKLKSAMRKNRRKFKKFVKDIQTSASFENLDDKFLKPFFTAHDRSHSETEMSDRHASDGSHSKHGHSSHGKPHRGHGRTLSADLTTSQRAAVLDGGSFSDNEIMNHGVPVVVDLNEDDPAVLSDSALPSASGRLARSNFGSIRGASRLGKDFPL